MVEAKAHDQHQGEKFSILWSKQFCNIFKRESQDVAFCSVFHDNLKLVVSQNNNCHFEVLHVSRNVDYVP